MTEIPGMVERVARAICCPSGCDRATSQSAYIKQLPCNVVCHREAARAAIAAHEAALSDAGWVLVPREATHAMSDAYIRARDVSTERWEAMVAAAHLNN